MTTKPKTERSRRNKTAGSEQDPIMVPIDKIYPSRENDKLYRPVDPNEPATVQLANSIRQFGVMEPLVLTRDYHILSGHRRFAAAQVAGLEAVPARFSDIRRDSPEYVRILREFNRQREKSLDERLREEIVSLDPDDAYNSLLAHRAEAAAIKVPTVDLDAPRSRAEITSAKQPMLDAILEILRERRAYWPLSDRAIHYVLCDKRPLRHAKKKESKYVNDQNSYKSAVDLLTRARLEGLIPMEAISDETRPVSLWDVYTSPVQFIQEELQNFARGYWRDLMSSQPVHVEILCEKNTVEPIIRPIAEKYTIPLTSGRGFCSLPPRQQMNERFLESGKDRMVIVIASDFDPEGESICESFARSMRDDFHVEVSAVKAALTWEQTQSIALPRSLEAKKTSSRYPAFARKYGDAVYELEALGPQVLQSLVDEAVRSVIDIGLFNRESACEKNDAQWLDVTRRRMLAALNEISIVEREQ